MVDNHIIHSIFSLSLTQDLVVFAIAAAIFFRFFSVFCSSHSFLKKRISFTNFSVLMFSNYSLTSLSWDSLNSWYLVIACSSSCLCFSVSSLLSFSYKRVFSFNSSLYFYSVSVIFFSYVCLAFSNFCSQSLLLFSIKALMSTPSFLASLAIFRAFLWTLAWIFVYSLTAFFSSDLA